MRALLLLTLIVASSLAAQSYSVSSGSVSYTDLSSPTPSNLTAAAQLTAAISPSGFSFTYFGTTYTSFKLGSGGYMIMGSAGTSISKFPAHGTAPGLVIAPDWSYLAPGSSLYSPFSPSLPPAGSCNYLWSGSVLSVEWKNVPLQTSSSTGVRMKVVIDTASGIIEFQYGSLPNGCTGAMASAAHTAAISGPSGASQEIIDAADTGYIAGGIITTWPAGRYVRFTPNGAPVNTAPALTIRQGGNTLAGGATVNVNHGIALSALGFEFEVDDVDADNVSVTASVTNMGATGMVLSEWQSGSAGVPYTLYPTSGVFNTAAGATHTVMLTADDGQDVTNFTFDIVQAPAPASPSMSVSDGAAVNHGQGAAGTARDFGSLDITAGLSSPVTITISNAGPGTLNLATFSMTGDTGDFQLDTSTINNSVGAGGSTSFSVRFDPASVGQKFAQVTFGHDDPAISNPFSVEFTGLGTSVTPLPAVVVRETSTTGPLIANGAAPAGLRAFGSMDITATPSAAITIVVHNAGTASLTVGAPFSTNGDFTVDATGFPPSITAGGSATFTVSFTPAAVGVKSASIQFTHNDASTATPFSFGVSGEATSVTPGPGPGNTAGGAGGGGGGGCVVNNCDYWLIVFILVAIAGLGARTRRQRAR
jgi:hypothetical protein